MRGKYGRTAVALHEAARFEAIELVLYGETMEWAAEVLRPVLPAGGGVVDVCPALGGLTLALAVATVATVGLHQCHRRLLPPALR